MNPEEAAATADENQEKEASTDENRIESKTDPDEERMQRENDQAGEQSERIESEPIVVAGEQSVPTETQTDVTLKPGLKGVFTFNLMMVVLSCAFGSSFQAGYHAGCMNTPADVMMEWQANSFRRMHGYEYPAQLIWSITVGIMALGAFLSTFPMGKIADKWGRKRSIIYNNSLVFIFCIMMYIAYIQDNYILMILARFIIGFNYGFNSGLCPSYFTEIAPTNLRGAVGCVSQLFVWLGILVSQIIGLPFLLGSQNDWIFIFALCPLFPALMQISIMSLYAPESPKFTFVLRGNIVQAEKDLVFLKGTEDVSDEIDLLYHEKELAKLHPTVGFIAMLKDSDLRWCLILGIFLMVSVQFSGISAVGVYSTQIFMEAKIKPLMAKLASCSLGVVNLIMILVSMQLVEHPKVGRRVLYVTSTAGCALFTGLFAIVTRFIPRQGADDFATITTGHWNSTAPKHPNFSTTGIPTAVSADEDQGTSMFSYISIVLIVLYSVIYAVGMGSISSVYLTEIFPIEARSVGSSIAFQALHIFSMFMLFIYPQLNYAFGSSSFFFFTASMIFATAFGFLALPETQKKVQERVQRDIKRKRKRLRKCCCLCC